MIAKESLLVFTRYPEPGLAKTRLIPALGVNGAANVHRQMTEHTLAQVRELQSYRPISVEVHFDGNKEQRQMQDWLGYDLVYQHQLQGDLGFRMARSLSRAFQSGTERVVIIGTDCPDLNALLMAQAFHQLDLAYDIVLGPAIDGGYYLIGLRYFIPELFSQISWGTAEVLSQTVDIANTLNLSIAYLTQLSDVDRPEDLPVWEKCIQQQGEMNKTSGRSESGLTSDF